MAVRFECKTTIEASQPAVFDLSLSVDAHLESMAGSKERAITGTAPCSGDMVEVNGRTFINNVSLGVYGYAVQGPA